MRDKTRQKKIKSKKKWKNTKSQKMKKWKNEKNKNIKFRTVIYYIDYSSIQYVIY